MLTLSISHNVFLTKQQRYTLYQGNEIETLGVSTPIWWLKGSNSEPALEVFCKYIITNSKEQANVFMALATGYKFNIPQIPEGNKIPYRIPIDVWDKLTNMQRDDWTREHPIPPNSRDLLDKENGGLKILRFKVNAKLVEMDRKINAIHTITIMDVEDLEKSILI